LPTTAGQSHSTQRLAVAYNNRGDAFHNNKDYDRAITDCNKAIELGPNFARAYVTRGSAYFNKSNRHRAIADYRKALELDPNNTVARNNLKRLGLNH
jgi:Flp pilus assembly protein TadD